MTYWTRWQSSFGPLLALAEEGQLTGLYLEGQRYQPRVAESWRYQPDLAVFIETNRQLEEYRNNQRHLFDLPLKLCGSEFQHSVWKALLQVPFGETCSYGQLAKTLGRPTAVRAVAAAIGRNPLLIVVPCHRVIGANGSLTGFAAGLETKRTLLMLESDSSLMRAVEKPVF